MLIRKIPEWRAFSFRGRSSVFEGKRESGVCCIILYHLEVNQNFVKNKSKTKKFPLTWYINCPKKFENRQKLGKQSSEARSMNMRIDILPLLATRKIPRSSEINITSHNWIYWRRRQANLCFHFAGSGENLPDITKSRDASLDNDLLALSSRSW